MSTTIRERSNPRLILSFLAVTVFSVASAQAATNAAPAHELSPATVEAVAPNAHAGVDRTVTIGERVRLDATRSSHAARKPLAIQWSMLSAPDGSAARIHDANALYASFDVDLEGVYVARLTLTDLDGNVAHDDVLINTANSRPVADAGRDVLAAVGELASLDGSRSGDADGDTLRYRWTLDSAPEGSLASLFQPATATPSLSVDLPGDYALTLKVLDANGASETDRVIVSTGNLAPAANAGYRRRGLVGDPIALDGLDSLDANGDLLAYQWTLLHGPAGHDAAISAGQTPTPVFSATVEGNYLAQLIVNDGQRDSAPDTLVIEVHPQPEHPPLQPEDILEMFPEMGSEDFDGDGVPDPIDNCVGKINPDQRDTDLDGIGNFCDPDLNNDGVINFEDLSLLKSVFFSADPDGDFDGDGSVNFLDLQIMKEFFFLPPGPPGTITWINAAGGDWNVQANWFPEVIPVFPAAAVIDLAPDVTVNVNSGVAASAGNLLLNDTLVLNGGTLSGANVQSVLGAGTVIVTLSNTSLDGVRLNADMVIQNSGIATVTGDLEVNEVVEIQGSTAATGLQFDGGAQTLSGGGEIFFNSQFNPDVTETQVRPINGGSLVIGIGITVRGGYGRIGDAGLQTTIAGTVSADLPSARIDLIGDPYVVTGALLALNGAVVSLSDNLINAGNTITIDTSGGGSIRFEGNPLISDATFDDQGTGSTLTVPSAGAAFDQVILNTNILVQNSGLVTVTGDLTLNGMATVQGSSVPTGFQFDGGAQTLDGTGLVFFDSQFNSDLTESQVRPVNLGSLTIGPGIDFRGGYGRIGDPGLTTTVAGDVSADFPTSEIRIAGVNAQVTGTLQTLNGGVIGLEGTFDNLGATTTLDAAGGTVRLVSDPTLNNITFNEASASTIVVPSTNASFNNVDLNTSLRTDNSAIVTITGGLTVNGTVDIDGVSVATGLQFSGGNQIFDGNADVFFNAQFNSDSSEPQVRPVDAGTLLIGANVDFFGGYGRIGDVNLQTTILGDVTADLANAEIDIVGDPFIATGTLTAVNTGRLELIGTMSNGGAAVAVDGADGTVTLGGGLVINDAIINGTPGTTLIVTAGDATFNGLIVNSDLRIDNSGIVTVLNDLELNGFADVLGISVPTGFEFDGGSQSLTGMAEILLNAPFNTDTNEARVRSINGGDLTLGADVFIHGGYGSVGNNDVELTILGTVAADVAGSEIEIRGSSWSANNTLRAENGATLELNGTMNNASQGIALDGATGNVTFGAGFAGNDVSLNGTAGTSIRVTSGNASLGGATVTADMVIDNSGIVTVTDSLTLNGTARIDGISLATGFEFNGGAQTLDGNATIVFNAPGNPTSTEPRVQPIAGSLSIASSVLIRGGYGVVGSNGLQTIILGDVSADVSGTEIEIRGTDWQATGTLTADNGGRLSLRGSLDNGGAAVTIDGGGGTVTLEDNPTLANLTINDPSGTIIVVPSTNASLDGVVSNAGFLIENSGIVSVTNNLILNDTATVNGISLPTGFQFTSGSQTLAGSGTVRFANPGNSTISEPQVTATAGSLTIGANMTIIGDKGTVGLGTTGLTVNGTITSETSSGTMAVNGSTVTLGANGSINATTDADITVSNLAATSGTLSATTGGRVVVTGDLTLNAGGSVDIGVAGTAGASEYGQVTTQGTANLSGGTLNVSIDGAYTPMSGDSFDALVYNALGSMFGGVTGNGPFALSYGAGALNLAVP